MIRYSKRWMYDIQKKGQIEDLPRKIRVAPEDKADAMKFIYGHIVHQLWKPIHYLPEEQQKEIGALYSISGTPVLKGKPFCWPPRVPLELIESVVKDTLHAFDIDAEAVSEPAEFFNSKVVKPHPTFEGEFQLADPSWLKDTKDYGLVLELINMIKIAKNAKQIDKITYWNGVSRRFYDVGERTKSYENVKFALECLEFVEKSGKNDVSVYKGKLICYEYLGDKKE